MELIHQIKEDFTDKEFSINSSNSWPYLFTCNILFI